MSTVSGSILLSYSTINIQQSVEPAYRGHASAAYVATLSLVGAGIEPAAIGLLSSVGGPGTSVAHSFVILAPIVLPFGMLIVGNTVRRKPEPASV